MVIKSYIIKVLKRLKRVDGGQISNENEQTFRYEIKIKK
jgi:hypothetical protein